MSSVFKKVSIAVTSIILVMTAVAFTAHAGESPEDTPTLKEASLIYANYPDIIPEIGCISPRYHDENNPLALTVNGEHYNNTENYTATITIKTSPDWPEKEETVFAKNVTLSGKQLNDGYSIVLDGFTMDYMSPDAVLEDANIYGFFVKIGDSEKSIYADYVFGDMNSIYVHKNSQKNAGAGAFTGGAHFYRNSTAISRTTFDDNGSFYIYYITNNFFEDEDYEYEVYYGGRPSNARMSISATDLVTDGEKIANGTITGAELNAGMLGIKADNHNNHDYPAYVLFIKKDGKIVNLVIDEPIIWDNAGIFSLEISKPKEVFLGIRHGSYIISKGSDVMIRLTGVNFEEEKTYKISTNVSGLCMSRNCDFTGQTRVLSSSNQKEEIKGKKLNNGTANVLLKYNDDFENEEYISVRIEITDIDESTPSGYRGAYLQLQYKDLNELLANDHKYTIDSSLSMVKGIKKNTSLNDFAESFELAEGETIAVYDKTGKEKQTNKVGTGMIVRILDEFERPIIGVDAVVTGDVTGDGDISIGDLVKVARHVAEIDGLDGAYAEAADINGEGVGIGDLVKISRDVAGIEEVK